MRMILTARLALLVFLLASSLASAEDLGMYPIAGEDADSAMRVCPTLVLLDEAPRAYYTVFGQWPETFADIVDAGLIRSNLTIDGVNVLSPDDGEYNHPYDLLYLYRGPQTPPQFTAQGETTMPDDAKSGGLPEMNKLTIYSEQAKRVIERCNSPEEVPEYTIKYGSNTSAHKLLAIAYMCLSGAAAYRSAYGEYPSSWNDFVDTGFCPVTSDMLNPATGEAFRADGSPFSFEFQTLPDGAFTVAVHGDDGDYVRVW